MLINSVLQSWGNSTHIPRGADLCWELGGIIRNFIPISPYFQHWGDETRPQFFFQVSKLSEDQKKVFTKKETLFPRFQVKTCAQMHSRMAQNWLLSLSWLCQTTKYDSLFISLCSSLCLLCCTFKTFPSLRLFQSNVTLSMEKTSLLYSLSYCLKIVSLSCLILSRNLV